MENKEWLYCFTCGISHYHAFDKESGMWKCPNCHGLRMRNLINGTALKTLESTILKATEKAMQKARERKVQNG